MLAPYPTPRSTNLAQNHVSTLGTLYQKHDANELRLHITLRSVSVVDVDETIGVNYAKSKKKR